MIFGLKSGLRFFLTAIGIVFVGSVPSLFGDMSINISKYFTQLTEVFNQIVHPNQLVYIENSVSRPLFPKLFGPYLYSMEVFFSAFFVSLILALLLTYITFFLPLKIRRVIKFLTFIGESLPDIFIIIIFQLIVVWIYTKTHFLVVNTAGVWGNHIFLMPVICLCILPTFLLYRIIILSYEEEFEKDYIELAKSKGLHQHSILLRHVLRNVLVTVFFHSKTVIWVMISNLLIFEFLFNITGITLFMYDHPVPVIFTVSLLLIFLPVFILFTFGQLVIQKMTGQKVEG